MMRTTVSTQPQIIIVACCITLRRSAYDTAGNIRSITKDGTVTKSFGYTNLSWPDLLTSVTANGTTKDVLYEGQSQTSDIPSSGNPVTYYNGKDYTFTWTKGRQLASATVDGKQVSYTYDMSGVRTSKTVNGTTYNYTTLSGKVMRQSWGNKFLEFVYDDKAATDASLGWGSNLIIAGATTAATAPRAPQKSKHKKNNVSEYRYAKEDHIRWKYYAEHFANIG